MSSEISGPIGVEMFSLLFGAVSHLLVLGEERAVTHDLERFWSGGEIGCFEFG
jgi:hypothetical protein